MSDMTPDEAALEVIGEFLLTVQGQGLQVLIELATDKRSPAAVRLNAALALTGLYEEFVLDVAEAYGPEVTEQRGGADGLLDPPERYGPGTDFDPGAYPQNAVDEIAEFSNALEAASPELMETIKERLAAATQVEQKEDDVEDVGGTSGIGPRTAKTTQAARARNRKRKSHGRK